MSSKDWLFIFIISLLLFGLQSYINPIFVFQEANYLAQPYDLRGLAKALIFVSVYTISILTILMVVFSRSKCLFFISTVWISITYGIDIFIQLIGAYRGISTEELSLAISQFHLTKNLRIYSFEIILSCLFAAGLFSLMKYLRIRFGTRINPYLAILVSISAFIGIYSSSKNINTVLINSYPAPLKSIVIIYDYMVKTNIATNRLLDPEIRPLNQTEADHIVWIIDESATGSFLSINGFTKKTTPFLEEELKQNQYLKNFGDVNAISNCSNYSNLFLRTGMHPSFPYDTLQHLPSILSYTKNAGYRNIMMDAQITSGEFTNFLNLDEVNLIDEWHTLNRSVYPKERDKRLSNKLFEILKREKDEKLFILFIKFGCHWPYLLNYENNQSIFQPIQSSTATRMISSNKEVIVNTYLNSIFHNVDLFFQDLIIEIDPNTCTVFYTADHGQSILENETARTHCSNNVDNIPRNEFSVPLLVYSNKFKNLNPKEKYSQIQIFPTTLELMGYDQTIYNIHGPTLFSVPSQPRQSLITGTGQKVDFD